MLKPNKSTYIHISVSILKRYKIVGINKEGKMLGMKVQTTGRSTQQ